MNSSELFPRSPTCSPPPLPSIRIHHALFTTEEPSPRVALCGGEDETDYLASCLVLDPGSQSWEENMLGELPQPRGHQAVVSLKDIGTYLIGGDGAPEPRNLITKTTVFLEHESQQWVAGPEIPVEMDSPCAVVITRDSFLVMHDNNLLEYRVDKTNPTSKNGWQDANKWPNLFTSRTGWAGCSKIKDKVVIAGGFHPNGWNSQTHRQTEVLDLATRKISITGEMNMNTPRRGFHIVTITTEGFDKALALAGYGDSSLGYSTTSNSVEEFDPESLTWKSLPSNLEERRGWFGAVALPICLVCTGPAALAPPVTATASEETIVLLTGGRDDSFGTATISSSEVFPSTSNCSPPALPAPRREHALFITAEPNPKVAVCGGVNESSDAIASCLVFQQGNQTWDEKTMGPLLQPRHQHAVVSLKNIGNYMIGGYQTDNYNTTDFLGYGSREWVAGPAIPVKMNYVCAVEISDRSFLLISGNIGHGDFG